MHTAMEKNNVIHIKNLHREFRVVKGFIKKKIAHVTAIKDVSFDVYKGEIFGLIGPNGAGKTTTIKILSTLLAPSSGTCQVLGHDVFGEEKHIRSKINFIFGGESGVYRRLSARDNLIYFSNLYNVPSIVQKTRIPELLDLVGLTSKADMRVETYSKGMIQRLQIARGLINDPQIIFMDEPTIGLDPVGASELREIIKRLSSLGKTIVLTTHYMFEVDELCDRVAIIKDGQIIACDTPVQLKKGINADSKIIFTLHKDSLLNRDALLDIEYVRDVQIQRNSDGNDVVVYCQDYPENVVSEIIRAFPNVRFHNISIKVPTLEDVYINLVGDKK